MNESAPARAWPRFLRPLAVVRYLVLRTETHAYCGALAFFALVGFYPSCLLLLWFCRSALQWSPATRVVLDALREYYPEGQGFLLRNLEVSGQEYGRVMGVRSAFWVLLGAAGIFIPLETAFNELWGAREHRPYWRNQAVGFLLTSACCVLGVLFVVATAFVQAGIAAIVPIDVVAGPLRYVALRVLGLGFAVAAIFLFYRFLPNTQVRSADVFRSALLAGVVTEGARVLYVLTLPLLDLQRTQGPYYISISFVLLVYFLSFVLLGGAFFAAGRRPQDDAEESPGSGGAVPGSAPAEEGAALGAVDPPRRGP